MFSVIIFFLDRILFVLVFMTKILRFINFPSNINKEIEEDLIKRFIYEKIFFIQFQRKEKDGKFQILYILNEGKKNIISLFDSFVIKSMFMTLNNFKNENFNMINSTIYIVI